MRAVYIRTMGLQRRLDPRFRCNFVFFTEQKALSYPETRTCHTGEAAATMANDNWLAQDVVGCTSNHDYYLIFDCSYHDSNSRNPLRQKTYHSHTVCVNGRLVKFHQTGTTDNCCRKSITGQHGHAAASCAQRPQ